VRVAVSQTALPRTVRLANYIDRLIAKKPQLKTHNSKHTWLLSEMTHDVHVRQLMSNIQYMLELPTAIMNKSDVQVLARMTNVGQYRLCTTHVVGTRRRTTIRRR
jgi:hypothetical protein